LGECVRALRPGGMLVVKEVVDRPRWKYWLAYVEEWLAIRVLRVTKGSALHFEPEAVYAAHLAASGIQVSGIERVDVGRMHAHRLFYGTKGCHG
jgi:hypothetical protein